MSVSLDFYTIRYAGNGDLFDRHPYLVCGEDAEAAHLASLLARSGVSLQVFRGGELVATASMAGASLMAHSNVLTLHDAKHPDP